jgi:hypothetical protein
VPEASGLPNPVSYSKRQRLSNISSKKEKKIRSSFQRDAAAKKDLWEFHKETGLGHPKRRALLSWVQRGSVPFPDGKESKIFLHGVPFLFPIGEKTSPDPSGSGRKHGKEKGIQRRPFPRESLIV